MLTDIISFPSPFRRRSFDRFNPIDDNERKYGKEIMMRVVSRKIIIYSISFVKEYKISASSISRLSVTM